MQAPSTLIHITHASGVIPTDLRSQFLLNDAELSIELERLTDHFTDELFFSSNAASQILSFPVSRFVVDPERYSDDTQEPMAERGHGVIYTGTTDCRPLRRKLSNDERTELLELYYVPHHSSLTAATQQSLEENGFVTIVDAHSFPDIPLPVDLSQQTPRPDICIGTDSTHTPRELVELVYDHFLAAGFSVRIDDPYAGTIVPLHYFGIDNRVSSIMIEINRRLYLDGEPGNFSKNDQFDSILGTTQAIVESVISWTKRSGSAAST